MNRKAQIFTVLAILLIMLMFASFEIFSSIRERESIKTRVSSMDSFLNSIEDNLERQMYISGFRILFLAEGKITSQGYYVNVNDFFQEAFFNGTVGGVANQSILTGATYSDFLDSINNKAKKINVVINMANSTINITQEDPWNVKFTLTSDFIMNDREGLASWKKTQVISAYIPVEGFEDPSHVINTRVLRKINKTIYTFDNESIANLSAHFDGKYYIANPDAPSFLKRLEGDFTPDPNGIETFIDTYEIQLQGYSIKPAMSVVDYVYFTDADTGSSVSGMPFYFKIDDGHKPFYQIP